MQVKSIDDLIDEFEVEINTELNDPIKSKTGEDILEEVEGAKRRTEVLNLRIIQAINRQVVLIFNRNFWGNLRSIIALSLFLMVTMLENF